MASLIQGYMDEGKLTAAERERKALKVVGTLPVAQRRGRRLEIVEGSMAPEFFVIDSMAALDLAILLRASRPDVSMADPRFLDRKREG